MSRPAPVLALIASCLAVEVIVQLGDAGFLGGSGFRPLFYEYGGFWPGLLANWQPNYPGQAWTMFLTYGFLHAGLLHLAINMVTLWSLGGYVGKRIGGWRLSLLYALGLLGGSAGYALLGSGYTPMVGASGALFGLAGAILAWDYVDRFALQDRLWPVAQAVALLIALNAALYFAVGGMLAWEAHLGGFVAGWIAALLIDPVARRT